MNIIYIHVHVIYYTVQYSACELMYVPLIDNQERRKSFLRSRGNFNYQDGDDPITQRIRIRVKGITLLIYCSVSCMFTMIIL